MLTKADLEQFRTILETLRARIRGDVRQLTDEALDQGNDSKSPMHIAELGSGAYEQDFALQFVENDQETLNEISAALQRIDAGTYGLCEMCLESGRPASKAGIRKTRLRAIPHARNCIACERKREELSS